MFGRRIKLSSALSISPVGGSNNGRANPPPSPVPVLIQRLIILHDGLMPLPNSSSNDVTSDADSHSADDEGGEGEENGGTLRTTSDDETHHSNEPKRQPGTIRRRRNPQALLNEDASLEEHGEFILYYYDHSLYSQRKGGRISAHPTSSKMGRGCSDKNDDDEGRTSLPQRRASFGEESCDGREKVPDRHATQEAVQFAGLCRALRSLPIALRPQPSSHESDGTCDEEDVTEAETDVVHLSDSTLVFVPLELEGDIIAIAQIPRSANRRTDSSSKQHQHIQQRSCIGYGADPTAIRDAVRRIHAMFSLVCGGGIHRRLLRIAHLESSEDWALGTDGSGEVEEEGDTEDGEKGVKKLSVSSSFSRKITTEDDSDENVGDNTNASYNNISDYRYGGMEELFHLRREHRQSSNPSDRFGGLQRNRWASNSNSHELFNDIANNIGHNDCQRRIEKLLEVLPISLLRVDLTRFYDDWVGRLQGLCEVIEGGVGRCVVEMVPAPTRPISGGGEFAPTRGQHPPVAPSAFVSLAAAEMMKSLMSDERYSKGSSQLLGMSFFHQNRLVVSELSSMNKPHRKMGKLVLPSEIPCLMLEYFRYHQKREVELKRKAFIVDTAQTQSASNALDRLMSNLSVGGAPNTNAKYTSQATPYRADAMNVSRSIVTSGYCSPPQLSLEDMHRQSDTLSVTELGCKIWLPRIHHPLLFGNDENVETHAALYEQGEFSFILFFCLHLTNEKKGGSCILVRMARELGEYNGTDETEESSTSDIAADARSFSEMMYLLSNVLYEFCEKYASHDPDAMSTVMAPIKEVASNSVFVGEAGMDIICIDRDEGSFVLLSHHDLASRDFQRSSAAPTANGMKGLFGIGSKIKQTCERENESSVFYRPSPYTNLMDCRHKLAAHLPLDVMIAFDDMFNEIGRLTRRRNVLDLAMSDEETVNEEVLRNDSIELCTFLPQGWVYGRANGSHELFVLLDTKKFVTISDVQKAVNRVRERIFNEKLL